MKQLEPVAQPIPQVSQVLTCASLCRGQNRRGCRGWGGWRQQAELSLGSCPGGQEAGHDGGGVQRGRRVDMSGLLSSTPSPLSFLAVGGRRRLPVAKSLPTHLRHPARDRRAEAQALSTWLLTPLPCPSGFSLVLSLLLSRFAARPCCPPQPGRGPALWLPGLPSVVEVAACSVGQGQGPSHLTASCLLLRQACCSSLHCTGRAGLGDGARPMGPCCWAPSGLLPHGRSLPLCRPWVRRSRPRKGVRGTSQLWKTARNPALPSPSLCPSLGPSLYPLLTPCPVGCLAPT